MSNPAAQQKSILIVEDEEIIRDTLSEFLSGEGFQVGAAGDVEEALKLVRERDYESIVDRLRGPVGSTVQLDVFRDAKVLVLGLAYKPNVADTRESPSFELIRLLRDLGAEVVVQELEAIEHSTRFQRIQHVHDLGGGQAEVLSGDS